MKTALFALVCLGGCAEATGGPGDSEVVDSSEVGDVDGRDGDGDGREAELVARDDGGDDGGEDACACVAGASEPCATTCGSTGTRSCNTACAWDPCLPPAEACGDGIDQDCDTTPDDGCPSCTGTTGRVRVELDGRNVFDRGPFDRSLRCLGLRFAPGDYYGCGPPGAEIRLVHEEPGRLEVQLVNFDDDHGGCGEKWGFLRLVADCACGRCVDVLLEKWNISHPDYIPNLKVETWIDRNGLCDWAFDENDEPRSADAFPDWDPGQTYSLVVTWE